MNDLIRQAPAKINLHLRVGKRRGDGFHPLLSWMTTIGLFDTLEFQRALGGSRDWEFALRCSAPDLPIDSGNLVVRAAAALADTLRRTGEGPVDLRKQRVSAFLHKRIPVGAGLGGGSSDAAATLLALNDLWQAKLPREKLDALAAEIGSDVPFFLHGPSSSCTGRGEKIRAIAPPAARFAVLVLPKIALSTAEVYRRFDELARGDDAAIESESPFAEWSTLLARELLPRLVNDLEPAAYSLAPQLGELRTRIERSLGRPVRMSGSGSSLFTLFDSREEAQSAAKNVSDVDVRIVDVAP